MQLIQTVLVIYTAVNLHIRMSVGDEECWALVFKVATGGEGNAYNFFTSSEASNGGDKEAMSLHRSKKHFKSEIVNKWSSEGIDQVRVSLYVSGIEKAFLLFDGRDTTSTNWFDKTRLVDSSYSDLDTNVKFFSVKGITDDDKYSRRFYIRKNKESTCKSDYGWLLVGEKKGNCDYETKIKEKTYILFSNSSNIMKAKEFALADSMAIFVKLSIKATCLIPPTMNCVHENLQHITSTVSTSTVSTSTVSTSTEAPQSITMTNEDLQNKVDMLKMDLTIARKTTQKYKRSLVSAQDDRTSSKIMGIIGGSVIIVVIGFIILLDCTTCNRDSKVKSKKIK